MAEENLEERLKRLENKLSQEQQADKNRHDKRPRSGSRVTTWSVLFCLLVVGVLAALIYLGSFGLGRGDGLPRATVRQINRFRPYYLSGKFSTDFVLQPGSVSLQSGVLVFSMKNPSSLTLVFTEEPLPSGFDLSTLQADKQFNTEYGQAFVTDAVNRTTGALVTSDKTWILVNAPTPIGADLMQQILNALVPDE